MKHKFKQFVKSNHILSGEVGLNAGSLASGSGLLPNE